MEKLYTVKEVAEYLKLNRDVVYRYIYAGSLKSIKINGNVRIKESDLKKFVEGDEVKDK